MTILEKVEREKPRPRRSFTAEFEAEIVELRCAGLARFGTSRRISI